MDVQQTLAKYILDPLFAVHEKSNHLEYLHQFEKSQYYTPEKLKADQLHLLKVLVLHAYKNCPFYKVRFDDAGFDPTRFQDFSDIRKIPVLTKSDIQKNVPRLQAQNFILSELFENKTGGSTGAPLLFYLDKERLFSRKASTFRHDRWTGWDVGVKTAVLWGHHRDFLGVQTWKSKFRKNFYDRKLILDTSDLTAAKMESFNDSLNSFQPEVYLAYANSIFLFARFLKEKNISAYHQPKSIITSAELLTEEQRQLIEEIFCCKVYNRYGCRETSIVASECEAQNGMHISAETLYLEFDTPSENTAGKIIITDLLNYGMPLIRYQIEDMGKPLEGACSCGRSLPRMEISGGRVTDFLVTADGRVISGASMTIYFIATIPGIAQAQIVQKQKDELKLKIIKSDRFDNGTENEIDRNVKKYFGSGMHHEIEYVEKIPTTASGKYRFSISELDPMEFLS